MYRHIFLNTVLALLIPSIFSVSTISTLAQSQPSAPSIPSQEVTIPQFSAITISFPSAVTFDAGKKNSLPMAVLLSQPLLDSNGNIIAPANIPVSIQIQPTKGGAQIRADALVIQGRIIPIQALSPLLPSQTITSVSSSQKAQLHQAIYGGLGGSVFGIFGSATGADRDEISNFTNMGNFVGAGLGVISGLISPKKSKQVQIPQSTMYILTLQASVTIPSKVAQSPPPASPPATPAVAAKPPAPTPATPTPAAATPTPAVVAKPPTPATPTPAATAAPTPAVVAKPPTPATPTPPLAKPPPPTPAQQKPTPQKPPTPQKQ